MTERVTDRKMNVLADYRYLADGTKIGVTDQSGNGYEYLGSLIYRHTPSGLELESTDFSGGRIDRTTAGYRVNYFVRDYLGSVRAIADERGQRIESMDYLPFGSRWNDPQRLVTDNRYLYNGKEWQPTGDLNVLDYGARHYDPTLGRWFNPDPAMQFLNPYTFCANDPVNLVDPDGCFALGNGNSILDDILGHIKEIKDKEDSDKGPESVQKEVKTNDGGGYHYYQTTDEFGVIEIYRFTETEWLVLNSFHSEEAMFAAMEYLDNPSRQNFLRMVRKELAAQWKSPELLIMSASLTVSALSPKTIKLRYAKRVFEKAMRDPVAHNFPHCIDKIIFTAKPIITEKGYKIYKVFGKMNGKLGYFEIGVNRGVVDHRFFRPLKN